MKNLIDENVKFKYNYEIKGRIRTIIDATNNIVTKNESKL